MKRLLDVNWIVLLALVALTAAGLVFIRSAGAARDVAALQTAWRVQAYTALAGLGIAAALALCDYRRILTWTAWPAYGAAIFFLVAVLIFGAKIYGGRRWLWFFQPSEVAKLAVIAVLAHVFGRGKEKLLSFKGFLLGAVLAGVPALLILAEPDLGTALVLVPTATVMLLAARVWTRGITCLLVVGALAASLIVSAVYAAETASSPEARERILKYVPLKHHQLDRVKVFLFPDSDPYGGGWNLRQAKISIGSGSLTGKGIGKGDQKMLGYLPPSVSMNDFIFSVLAEEAGFAGSLGVLTGFLTLLLAGLYTAFRCTDDRGRLLAIGVLTLTFSHVFVNIAMSVGLLPITGLPLPFISAGKTFLVMLLAAFGLVQSVSIHKGVEIK